MKLRDYQERAIQQTREALADGYRVIALVLPTGAGKTVVAAEIIRLCALKQKRAMFVTNRRVLLSQGAKGIEGWAGIRVGIIAAGYHWHDHRDVHVGSLQTIDSRALRDDRIDLPDIDLLVIDEAHSNTSPTAQKLMQQYPDIPILGLTATPVGLSKAGYELLVQGANYRELIEHGSLVPVQVYAPFEPDLNGLKANYASGEYAGASKRLKELKFSTHVLEELERRIPPMERRSRPLLMFAPDVPSSVWFTEQLNRLGWRTAHIDHHTPDTERSKIFEDYNEGRLDCISSFGVLREGFDSPRAEVAALCQPCSGIHTYLQIVGRVMRPYPGKTEATLLDFVGAWWRHGPPDEDREWELGDDAASIAAKRKKRISEGKGNEGIVCHRCGHVRQTGKVCPMCAYESTTQARKVLMGDGRLRLVSDPPVKRKRQKSPEQKFWDQLFWEARNQKGRCGQTFKQIRARFCKRFKRFPAGLVNTPIEPADWGREVRNVSFEDLVRQE